MSPFVLLFVQNFLFWTAFNSASLLPPYLTSIGASQTVVGLFNILGILVTVVSIIVFGQRLVALPRVKALRWGYVCLAAASGLSWVFAASIPALIVLRLVAAVSQVFASTLMVSVLFDLTPPEKRTSGLALFSISGMMTNPVSSMAGEAVLRTFGGPALFILTGVLALVALAWSTLIREPPARAVEAQPLSFVQVVVKPDLRALVILTFLFGFFFTVMTTFLPRHTQVTLGEANLSALLIPFSVVSVAMRLILGRQMDKKPPRRFLHLSFLSVFVSQLCLLMPPAWGWLVAAGAFYGLGHSILYPLLNTLFVQAGGEDQKSVYSNAYTVANLAGAILITPVLGALGDWLGFDAIIAVLAVAALASFFLVREKFPKPPRSPRAGRPSARSS